MPALCRLCVWDVSAGRTGVCQEFEQQLIDDRRLLDLRAVAGRVDDGRASERDLVGDLLRPTRWQQLVAATLDHERRNRDALIGALTGRARRRRSSRPPEARRGQRLPCAGSDAGFGPRTDRDGRILHVSGAPIPGLFAAGNAMAGVTGRAYGGAGGTIGPAMVFGYRAGVAAATGKSVD